MTVITMSRKELTRLRVLIDVADGRLSVDRHVACRLHIVKGRFWKIRATLDLITAREIIP
jgi:hypothetical protein